MKSSSKTGLVRAWLHTLVCMVVLTAPFTFGERAFAATSTIPSREQVVEPTFYGEFSNERSTFQELILSSFVGGHRPSVRPRTIFVSGAFASGKTSFVMKAMAQQGLDPASTVVVDSDVMRALLPEWTDLVKTDPPRAVETTNRESGYLAERLFWLAMAKNFNVVFVSAHRDLDFTKKFISILKRRYPERGNGLEWIHVENATHVLRDRIAVRNGTDPRKTDTERAFRSVIQSRNTFRGLLPILPRALEVIISHGDVQVTSVHENGKSSAVNARLESDLRTLKPRLTRSGYDIVVDLDWTLLSPIPVEQRNGRTGLIQFGADAYAVAPGAVDVLIDWISRGDVRVHIFSGGELERNRAVLAQMKTPFGSSLLELIESRGGQVWSRENLTPFRETGGLADRFRKRVEGLLPDVDPKRLIGIDDQIRFGDGWLKMIPSFGIYNDRMSFQSANVGLKYEPPSASHWLDERGRWPALNALVVEAIEADQAGIRPFRETLIRQTATLQFGTPEWTKYRERGEKQLRIRTDLKMCRAIFHAS